ncbi:MAG: antibiotic biosynthesis monooxygenase [Bradyrhizobiaceae bacterium]|nr:antibiotic biosynthesis monooxygenase [Bradyrhizobiaceae bacterium]
MTAYNVVRFRTKPGMEQAFIDAHRKIRTPMKGMRRFALIRTGDRSFCVVGEWNKMDSIAAARPAMIGILDGFRHMLEDLGGGLGLTDPVSGTVEVDLKPAQPRRRPAAKKRAARKKKKSR